MAAAPTCENETARLEALRQYTILDTPAEMAFDELTQLAAYVCGTPSALVTLVDARRQWFKSRAGFDATETPRELAFCAYTILRRDVFEVRDAAADPRFFDNPLVTDAPHIRFYAGAPLITSDGFALGSIAVLDYVPRQLDDDQKRALVALSHQVIAQLELRRRLADQRRQGEVAVRDSLERFELVARATNDAVWDWDVRADTVWWSEGFETLFGYRRGDLTPGLASWLARLHDDDRARVQHGLEVVLEHGGTSWAGEYRFRRADGSYADVFDRGYLIRDPDGKAVRMIGAMMDITARKHLEEQLRQSQKMDAIGQLSGGISHDFNNLLTVIQCSAMLLARPCPTAEVKQRATDILEAAERAASLTRQLLLVSRKQVLQPTALDLNEVVRNLTRMLQRIVGEDIQLHTEYAADLPALHGDVGMLEQVLLNLVVNARDAMPRGGRLTIATRLGTVDEAEAQRRPGSVVGRCARLEVTDTGVGIAPEVLPHVFEPFFTTKAAGKGTGLGLATVYGIVKQHGGWIEVASQPGEGTTFTICLPVVAPGDAAAPGAAADRGTPLAGSETILVVEDEAAVRALVVSLLEQRGYTVLQAASGVEALEIWQRARDRIDLLLTDVIMPGGMSGRELAERLRRDRPELAVIYTSGYVELPGPGEPLVDGRNFVQKPYHPDRLAQIIRDQLDRS